MTAGPLRSDSIVSEARAGSASPNGARPDPRRAELDCVDAGGRYGAVATGGTRGRVVPVESVGCLVEIPRAVASLSQVLALGEPGDLVQFIDPRDVAAWLVDASHAGQSGVFNLT